MRSVFQNIVFISWNGWPSCQSVINHEIGGNWYPNQVENERSRVTFFISLNHVIGWLPLVCVCVQTSPPAEKADLSLSLWSKRSGCVCSTCPKQRKRWQCQCSLNRLSYTILHPTWYSGRAVRNTVSIQANDLQSENQPNYSKWHSHNYPSCSYFIWIVTEDNVYIYPSLDTRVRVHLENFSACQRWQFKFNPQRTHSIWGLNDEGSYFWRTFWSI